MARMSGSLVIVRTGTYPQSQSIGLWGRVMFTPRLLRRACAITVCSLIAVISRLERGDHGFVRSAELVRRLDAGTDEGAPPRRDVHPGGSPPGDGRGEPGAGCRRGVVASRQQGDAGASRTSYATATARSTFATTACTPGCRSSAVTSSSPRRPQGEPQTVIYASPDEIVVPSIDASVSASTARSDAARRSGLKAEAGSSVKVVYAAGHRPVLAWQTTVTGTQS